MNDYDAGAHPGRCECEWGEVRERRLAVELTDIVDAVADLLKNFDTESPGHKSFKPGIGPFGEPQLVREIANRLTASGISAATHRTPDMSVRGTWAIEFKIVRPFGDNDREAENWSQNLLHPYSGNVSLLGDALKLSQLDTYPKKCLFAIGYEHHPPRIGLDPLFASFELIARDILSIPLTERYEQKRGNLVHPTHQVVRCVAWQLEG